MSKLEANKQQSGHDVARTVTEAQQWRDLQFVIVSRGETQSSGRSIPYVEMYQGHTSVMETPVERIQKAAEDQKRREESA